MMLYICTKFHENISKGFELLPRHEIMTDRQMDVQMDKADGRTNKVISRAPPTSSGMALITIK